MEWTEIFANIFIVAACIWDFVSDILCAQANSHSHNEKVRLLGRGGAAWVLVTVGVNFLLIVHLLRKNSEFMLGLLKKNSFVFMAILLLSLSNSEVLSLAVVLIKSSLSERHRKITGFVLASIKGSSVISQLTEDVPQLGIQLAAIIIRVLDGERLPLVVWLSMVWTLCMLVLKVLTNVIYATFSLRISEEKLEEYVPSRVWDVKYIECSDVSLLLFETLVSGSCVAFTVLLWYSGIHWIFFAALGIWGANYVMGIATVFPFLAKFKSWFLQVPLGVNKSVPVFFLAFIHPIALTLLGTTPPVNDTIRFGHNGAWILRLPQFVRSFAFGALAGWGIWKSSFPVNETFMIVIAVLCGMAFMNNVLGMFVGSLTADKEEAREGVQRSMFEATSYENLLLVAGDASGKDLLAKADNLDPEDDKARKDLQKQVDQELAVMKHQSKDGAVNVVLLELLEICQDLQVKGEQKRLAKLLSRDEIDTFVLDALIRRGGMVLDADDTFMIRAEKAMSDISHAKELLHNMNVENISEVETAKRVAMNAKIPKSMVFKEWLTKLASEDFKMYFDDPKAPPMNPQHLEQMQIAMREAFEFKDSLEEADGKAFAENYMIPCLVRLREEDRKELLTDHPLEAYSVEQAAGQQTQKPVRLKRLKSETRENLEEVFSNIKPQRSSVDLSKKESVDRPSAVPPAAPVHADVPAPKGIAEDGNVGKWLFLAKTADEAERFDDMVSYMRKVLVLKKKLDADEEKLLLSAWKKKMSPLRDARSIIQSIIYKEIERLDTRVVKFGLDYLAGLEAKMHALIDEVISTVYTFSSDTVERKVLLAKAVADYNRYKVEISEEPYKTKAKEEVRRIYKEIIGVAESQLAPINATRLGLMLNYTVFLAETDNNKPEAVETARRVFDDAIGELDEVSEEDYKDVTLIMQLLRDNINQWAEE